MKTSRGKQKVAATSDVLGVDLEEVVSKLRVGKGVRRTLRPGGRLHIDRPLPFLFVYRQPSSSAHPGTEALITTQASYLWISGERADEARVAQLIRAIVCVMVDAFKACLVLEVSVANAADASAPDAPFFRIVATPDGEPAETVADLEAELSQVSQDNETRVEVERRAVPSAAGVAPLLDTKNRPAGCFVMGLEIQPPTADASSWQLPQAHRQLRRTLARALKHAAFHFSTRRTTQRPSHFLALGRGRFLKAVSEADRQLAELSNRFDFLLLSTPRNTSEAWAEFRRSRFSKEPSFSYPPLPFDPALMKRKLYEIQLEDIEDPAMEDLFLEQQDGLDRRITMLSDRNTPRFRYGSLQVFGTVDDPLLAEAQTLLDRIPSRSREGSKGDALDARAFAKRARQELDRLRTRWGRLPAEVRIRTDIAGLMVSRGHLLVPSKATIPASRVDALLQHEIGTHIVTYYNGAAQPFRQLRNGLPGYDELQEGLAVLAEYLVGGLSRARLRILAARVVAVRRMIDGASFVDVFRELDRDYDFAQRTAYSVTVRVFRGGGQAKDAVYLRGLTALLSYLGEGGSLDPLLVGKIALKHLPVLHDLRLREVLVAPPFRPSYLDLPDAVARLESLRKGAQVIDLAKT